MANKMKYLEDKKAYHQGALAYAKEVGNERKISYHERKLQYIHERLADLTGEVTV